MANPQGLFAKGGLNAAQQIVSPRGSLDLSATEFQRRNPKPVT